MGRPEHLRGSGGWRSAVALCVAAGLALTAALAPPADATTDPTDPFLDGEWLGSLSADVTHSETQDGARMDYTARLDGVVGFDVRSGRAEGEWRLGGRGRIAMSGAIQGAIDQVYAASGEIDGDRSSLTMAGQQVVFGRGVFTIPEAGGTVDSGIVGPVTNPLGPMEVALVDFRCNLIVGDWETAIRIEATEQGLNPTVVGTFVVAYQGEAPESDLFARFEQLVEDGQAWERSYLETGELDAAVLNDLVNRIYELEGERRRSIEGCLFASDADRDTFLRLLTNAAAGLGELALTEFELRAANLDDLVTFLLSFGVVGSGAVDGTRAARLEAHIAAQVERILDDRVILDGESPSGSSCTPQTPCLGLDAEGQRALRVADRLDLTLEVAGATATAGEMLDAIDAWSPDAEDAA